MRSFVSWTIVLLLSGCGAQPEASDVSGALDVESGVDSGSVPEGENVEVDEEQSPCTSDDLCSQNGELDLEVTALLGSMSYIPRLVVAVAKETTNSGEGFATVTRISTSIPMGSNTFALSCPQSLHTNFFYPHVGVFIDQNDDGHCDAGDTGAETLLYGWENDFLWEVEDWFPLDATSVSGWSGTQHFCDYYGFTP
jgi:hypothetical protein